MPARAAWKGFLHVHQLQVPVKTFTASSSQPEIALNQLHAGCGERVRQLKVCPKHGELSSKAIVPGYECAEGRFLALDCCAMDALREEDSKAITVDCFVGLREVDAVYHSGRTYYVVPDGPPGQRPFGVLRDGMRASDRNAVARVVMNHREHLVLLQPHGRLLTMTVLEYPQRVRPAGDYEGEVAAVASGPDEQELIGRLIDALTEPQFDLSHYRDHYVDRLNALIAQRLAESDTAPGQDETHDREPEPADEEMLVAALRASLAAAGVDGPSARIPSRREGLPESASLPPVSRRA